MLFIETLLKSKKRFIDVGCNIGIFSFHFRNKFQAIEAFEPLSEVTYRLEALKKSSIRIHHIALSRESGKRKLNIPVINGDFMSGLASLENRKHFCESRFVNVKTLDSYNFKDVDLIKIDVEGHEKLVILGAVETLKRCRPLLIIEIAQVHLNVPMKEVFEIITNQHYQGYFLHNKKLNNIKNFEYKIHQEPFLANPADKNYINNFIFIPS